MATSRTHLVPTGEIDSRICAASVNSVVITANPGIFHGATGYSLDATPVYVRFYDMATAPAATDVPFARMMIPANATASLGAGNNSEAPIARVLTYGLGIRVTTGITDADTGALTANEVILNTFYSKR